MKSHEHDWPGALVFLVLFFAALAMADHVSGAEISLVEQERTMNRYLTDAEQFRLLAVLKKSSGEPLAARDYAWVRALMHSGLRINEFAQISVGDVLAALRTDYLFIPKEHRKGWNRKAGQGKRKPPKDLTVYITAALRQALQDLLKCRFELNSEDCHETDPMIPSRNGTRMTVRNYQQRLAFWAGEAGLPPGVSPHWLRHTRAMNIMHNSTARDPRGVVQHALGHSDIRSSGVYTQTPREEVEAALNEIDGQRTGRVSVAALRRSFEGRATA